MVGVQKGITLVVLTATLLIAPTSFGSPYPLPDDHLPDSPFDCTPDHPPIWIDGDDDFVQGQNPLTGETIYRPGSGVKQGNGTEEDPYLIEGWCIVLSTSPLTLSPVGAAGIFLQNTAAHVVIANNTVIGATESLTGSVISFVDSRAIYVTNGQNVLIRDNDILADRSGIQLSGSHHNEIRNNKLRGTSGEPCCSLFDAAIFIGTGSKHNIIQENSMSNHAIGVLVGDSDNLIESNIVTTSGNGLSIWGPDNLVQFNTVTNSYAGITGGAVPGSTIQYNTLNGNGFSLIISDEQVIRHNSITGSRSDGILIAGDGGMVYNNTITGGNNHGIRVYGSNHTFEYNTITENDGDGINLLGFDHSIQNNMISKNDRGIHSSEPATILGNNIHDNTQIGLMGYHMADPLIATNNWWGHESGPSGGLEDGCTGTEALGDGDSILVTAAEICFDPWLTEPNSDAGASDGPTPSSPALSPL